MDKHTPGPWSAQEESKGLGLGKRGSEWWVYADGAEVGRRLPAICQGPDAAANARLIAAAPDLLAWIQAFVAMLDYHNADVRLSFTGSTLNEDILAALLDARVTIRHFQVARVSARATS